MYNLWCRRPDLNRHEFPHYPLKIACLPDSTTSAHLIDIGSASRGLCRFRGCLFLGNKRWRHIRCRLRDGCLHIRHDGISRSVARHIRQDQRCKHEYNCSNGCGFTQERRCTCTAKKGLAGSSPESSTHIRPFSRLQKDDHYKGDTNNNMYDN